MVRGLVMELSLQRGGTTTHRLPAHDRAEAIERDVLERMVRCLDADEGEIRVWARWIREETAGIALCW
jgi:hypothetical protein